jgi:hypothetical protein
MHDFLKHKYFVPGFVVFLLATFIFYWFQLRPSMIKQDCSWVERHQDAIPTSTLDAKQFEHCNYWGAGQAGCAGFNGTRILSEQPAKDWWQSASDFEYKRCLHEWRWNLHF